MSGVPSVVPGTNSATTVALIKDGAAFGMAGQQCVATIVSPDNKTKLSETVTVSEAAAGSDWSASVVVVKFAPADTQAITTQGPAEIEIKVTIDGVDIHFWAGIELIKGHLV